MICLGIDPGLRYCGFGIAQKICQKVILLDYGLLQMSSSQSLVDRVGIFYRHYDELIRKYQVDTVILETPFLGKNAQNFLKLGYLRGILYLLADQHKLTILEFTPKQVKLAITGYGSADKAQVARVIQQLFPKMSAPKRDDVTDALAVTLCGVWQKQSLLNQQGKGLI
jgi:crossover junction endodeoxyribonuclease RuvC